jgi:ATP-dependent Clp protease adapter protein ClpS
MQIKVLMPTFMLPPATPETEEITETEEFSLEELQEEAVTSSGEGYRVILYNDDFHSMDEVILQLQKATGCTVERAVEIMMEAHTKGRAICHRGGRSDCQRVAKILREIRLQCEVDCD